MATILPQNFPLPGPDNHRSDKPPRDFRRLGLLSLLWSIVWFFLRPLMKQLAFCVVVVIAIWWFTPAWLAAPMRWLHQLPDQKQLADWTQQAGEKLKALTEPANPKTDPPDPPVVATQEHHENQNPHVLLNVNTPTK